MSYLWLRASTIWSNVYFIIIRMIIFNHHGCYYLVAKLIFVTPWTSAHQASLSFTISWSLLKFISIESMMLSNYLILCYPFLLLPSVFPSVRVFSNESHLVPLSMEFSRRGYWSGGLPRRLHGKESACQRRRHGFQPWSGKIPHASEKLSP